MKTMLFLGLLAAGTAQAAPQSTTTAQVAPKPTPQAILTAEVEAPSLKDRTDFQLKTGLLGRSLEDRIVNSKYAGGTIDLVGSHRISDDFSARMDLGFILSAGSYSNIYGSEGAAPNAFYVNEAAVKYQPFSILNLEAGVLLTQFSTMPSNMESMGFPSLRQSVELGNEDFKTQIYATQAIPTSDTAAVQSNQRGITTTLLMYGIAATTNPEDRKGATVSASVGRFEFKNLNASAATDSQFLGNSVDSAGGPQARFRYEFVGTEAGASMAYRFAGGTKISVDGSYMRNEKAPEKMNKGYLYTAGLENPIGNKVIKTSAGYFYNESDTLPASYTSVGKGSNNRFGQVARLAVKDVKSEVNGYVQYTRANEIVDKPYTADREVIVFGLEIAYDVL